MFSDALSFHYSLSHYSLYVSTFFYYIALFLLFYGVIVHYPGHCSLSSTLLSTFFYMSVHYPSIYHFLFTEYGLYSVINVTLLQVLHCSLYRSLFTIFPFFVHYIPFQPFIPSITPYFIIFSTVTIHYPPGHYISQSFQFLFSVLQFSLFLFHYTIIHFLKCFKCTRRSPFTIP